MEARPLVITLDVDWAPDVAIDVVAAELRDAGVRATWFVTHLSPAVERLRAEPDLFELGLHPNFFPESSHGDSLSEVLETVRQMAPEASSIRPHGLYQSSRVLAAIAADERLEIDASLFLPGHPHLRPVRQHLGGRTITRVPYMWADDHEMQRESPSWSLAPILREDGLKVLDFHPIHVFLNAADGDAYGALRAEAPDLQGVDPATARRFVTGGDGAGSLFSEAVENLRNASSMTLSDIAGRYADRV